jgi:hypothetical protein
LHGCGHIRPRTLEQIGKVYGITRERIRQIESKAMSKLRHPARSNVLRNYLAQCPELDGQLVTGIEPKTRAERQRRASVQA